MRTYFSQRQTEVYHAYETSKSLGNSVPKGHERELITSQFLSRHLPGVIQTTSGILIDLDTTDFKSLSQTTSPQLDLLLAVSYHPQLTLYGGTKIFFAESVAAVIEVKTNLTSDEIKAILIHCSKVKRRKRKIFGLYYADTGDQTTAPSETVPYYVISFESPKNAKELMEDIKTIGAGEGILENKALLPDGIFVLNPATGTCVLKDSGLHVIKTTLRNPPLYGGDTKTDALCVLWLTLMAQIESIRYLNFPYRSYSGKLFVTESQLIAEGKLPAR